MEANIKFVKEYNKNRHNRPIAAAFLAIYTVNFARNKIFYFIESCKYYITRAVLTQYKHKLELGYYQPAMLFGSIWGINVLIKVHTEALQLIIVPATFLAKIVIKRQYKKHASPDNAAQASIKNIFLNLVFTRAGLATRPFFLPSIIHPIGLFVLQVGLFCAKL